MIGFRAIGDDTDNVRLMSIQNRIQILFSLLDLFDISIIITAWIYAIVIEIP